MSNPDAPETFPSTASGLMLRGAAGMLESLIDVPQSNAARAGVAIVCHPHPLYGGSMHNKVVTTIERSLRELGLATVRFNFRGVGASEGVYDEGNGESQDLLAVAKWVQKTRPGSVLWLAGFSFGSYVAARTAPFLPVKQLISIAPPVTGWDFTQIQLEDVPWLVIQGEEDEVVDAQAVFAWAQAQLPTVHLIRMAAAGHFFHHRLMDLRNDLKNALQTNLPPLCVI